MDGLRIGSLFTGYGGLTLAVEQVFGGTTAWVSDIEQRDKRGALIGNAPLILEHRFPGVPNLGDITAVDWSQVEPVDIIDGGSPCQDVSAAGARAGMTEGTRSNLWVAMREAIAQLKPAIVIWENVAGALSAKAQSKEDRERQCSLCGRVDRRGGLYPHREVASHLQGEGDSWDERTGSGSPGGDEKSVGWRDVSDATRDEALGGGVPVVRLGGLSLGTPALHPSLPETETPPSGDWPSRRGGAECSAPPPERERALGFGGARGMRGAETANASAEQEGAACPECGATCKGLADSRVESEPGLLGGVPGGPALRAAGRVCGDLASLGFDSEWAVVRASDVGAPHQRARIFIVAAHPERIDRIWGRIGPGSAEVEGACASTARCDRAPVRLLPTPAASQYGSNQSLSPGAAVRPSLAAIDKLLPTPNAAKAANDLTLTKSGDGRDDPNKLGWAVALLPTPKTTDTSSAAPGDLRRNSPDLRALPMLLPTPRATRGGSATETVSLLPTPRATDGTKGGPNQRGSSGDLMLPAAVIRQFGDYATAVTRWEQVNGPAPDPTEGRRLSARFVEWLMGLSAGWVVDVPGLTRNQQLHALGNGVVPQQAAFAIRMLLTRLALREAS